MAAYDYKIEYLESTGTQWIDTGIIPTASMTFDADVEKTIQGNTVFFGARQIGTASDSGNHVYLNSYDGADGSVAQRGLVLFTYSADQSSPTYWSNWRHSIDPISRDVMYQCRGMTVNQSLVQFTKTISLFAFNNVSGINTSLGNGVKIALFRMYNNSVLSLELIPVVKNGVACMYDTVSGDFFYNQGTGSFTAGPKIEEPTTGLPMALAPFGGMGKKLPGSDAYVQSGLVHQWDGIDNAGRGIHSVSATAWKDLVSSVDSGTFYGVWSWTDSGPYVESYIESNASRIVVPGDLGNINAHTIEICLSVSRTRYAGRFFDSENYNSGNKRIELIYLDNYNEETTSKFEMGHGADGSLQTNGLYSFTRGTLAIKHPRTTGPLFINGAEVTGYLRDNWNQLAGYPSYINICNRSGTMNRGMDATVHAFRIYNRALSDSEIAANYAIDKQRFGV